LTVQLKVRKATTDTGFTNTNVMDSTVLYPVAATESDSSSENDGKTEKITVMKLCRNNWTEWKKYFKNLLVG
jgi:hypothetical protein